MKEIYFAGGCFWGVEEYFKRIPGVKKTRVGYANSRITNPTYEEVCAEKTGAVETVYVAYNPKVINIQKLISFFFRIIDPTAINRQGNDYGSQYRSGIYYVDESDFLIISEELKKLQKNFSKRVVVENQPLFNFYDAERYHQDYLTLNPHGYCHVNFDVLLPEEVKVNKHKIYNELLMQAQSLFNDASQHLSVLSNFSALIFNAFPLISWAGFYLNDGQKLVLGPFQGKIACETINYHAGVCGKCYQSEKPLIIADVHEFPGHIVCDIDTNSELVLPLYNSDDTLLGVFDLDSYTYDYFDDEDVQYLTKLLAMIRKFLKLAKLV